MTHARRHFITLFFQGFGSVTLMGLGLLMMLHTAASGAGWAAVGPLLVAMAIIVTGGILLAPGLARGLSSPLGRLFYPQKPLENAPLTSLACSLRQNGQFAEAMEEYRRVVDEFPRELEAHLEMVRIAVSDMEDQELGRKILLKALVRIEGEQARRELRDCFDCCCATLKTEYARPDRIAFDLFEDDTEGLEDD